MAMFRAVPLAAAMLACLVSAPIGGDKEPARAETIPEASYTDRVAARKVRQAQLSKQWNGAREAPARRAKLGQARSDVFRLIVDDLFPPWYGTPWDFNGTTQVPGEGHIACGYFVSTVLRDAGFRVQRIKLAQQASEKIVETLTQPRYIKRFSDPEIRTVLAHIEANGEGLYVVGLDYHVGFVVHEGARLDFCHSSYLGDAVVVCAPAQDDPAFVSRYYVVGKILTDPMMESWLEGDAIRVN